MDPYNNQLLRACEDIYYFFFFFLFFYFSPFLLVIFFFCILSYFWLAILVYLISAIMPLFIESFPSGLPSPAHQPFPRFYISSLWGKFEFVIDAPFKSIIFFYLGSSRTALLGLNNLFLVFCLRGLCV